MVIVLECPGWGMVTIYGNREAEPVIGGPVGGGELGYLAPGGPHAFEDIG